MTPQTTTESPLPKSTELDRDATSTVSSHDQKNACMSTVHTVSLWSCKYFHVAFAQDGCCDEDVAIRDKYKV